LGTAKTDVPVLGKLLSSQDTLSSGGLGAVDLDVLLELFNKVVVVEQWANIKHDGRTLTLFSVSVLMSWFRM
jgi:hypothetical protein